MHLLSLKVNSYLYPSFIVPYVDYCIHHQLKRKISKQVYKHDPNRKQTDFPIHAFTICPQLKMYIIIIISQVTKEC